MAVSENSQELEHSNKVYGKYAIKFIVKNLKIEDKEKKTEVLSYINGIIEKSLSNEGNEDNQSKFNFADKLIKDLQIYAEKNNLSEEFSDILGEHSKTVFLNILNGKEVFSGEEKIVDLKDETNNYVEEVLKNTFSQAYKYKMGIERLKQLVEGIDEEDKKTELETLITQIEENKEEYLEYSNDFVKFLEAKLEKLEINSSESKAILEIFKEVRDYNTLAHRVRGFGKDEASKEALENAIKANISELEFDIRFSKDGKAIIHHNATLGNSANRPEKIADLTYDELKDIKLKGGESITDLADFFEMVEKSGNKSTIINIDIKDFDKAGLDHILDLIKEYKFEHRVKIVSWSGQDLQYMYEKRPDLHYSLSYHPVTNGNLAKGLLTLQDKFSADNLLAKLGTLVSKYRAGLVHSTGQEIIKKTRIENGKEYFEDSKLYKDGGKGYHPMVAFSEKQGLQKNEIYKRVLGNGSVNIMAFDEIVHKMPKFIQKSYYKKLNKLIGELKELGIDTNVFDIKDEEVLKKYFNNVPEGTGTVYSSNQDTTIKMGENGIEEFIEDKKREILSYAKNLSSENIYNIVSDLKELNIEELKKKIKLFLESNKENKIKEIKEWRKSWNIDDSGILTDTSGTIIDFFIIPYLKLKEIKNKKIISEVEKDTKIINNILNILKELEK